MNRFIDHRAIAAFFSRELRAAMLNRFSYFFCGASLFAGLIPLVADPGSDITETATYTLLQASLYLVPLFSILMGVGSAQSEIEEQPVLMSQPVGRGARVVGKFVALWVIIGVAALLLVLPSLVSGSRCGSLLFIGLHTLEAGGVFAAMGLGIGFSTSDRVKAHMGGLCAWFIFLAGFDLLALAAAQTSLAQEMPQLWLALLMVNPLDALRVSVLLTLNRVPFDVATAPPLGRWWLGNLAVWFAILSAGWIALSLAWSRFRLERQEF